MRASDAYDLVEERTVEGLDDVLHLIKYAALEKALFVKRDLDRVTPEIIKALRRRKFHVTIYDFQIRKNYIIISWDPAKTGEL